jgi:hypothetical protein
MALIGRLDTQHAYSPNGRHEKCLICSPSSLPLDDSSLTLVALDDLQSALAINPRASVRCGSVKVPGEQPSYSVFNRNAGRGRRGRANAAAQ